MSLPSASSIAAPGICARRAPGPEPAGRPDARGVDVAPQPPPLRCIVMPVPPQVGHGGQCRPLPLPPHIARAARRAPIGVWSPYQAPRRDLFAGDPPIDRPALEASKARLLVWRFIVRPIKATARRSGLTMASRTTFSASAPTAGDDDQDRAADGASGCSCAWQTWACHAMVSWRTSKSPSYAYTCRWCLASWVAARSMHGRLPGGVDDFRAGESPCWTVAVAAGTMRRCRPTGFGPVRRAMGWERQLLSLSVHP